MGQAKNITLAPIKAKDANLFIKRVHYSGKVVQNSQLHIGVFYHNRLEGVMQFGPSLDKSKLLTLVRGSAWNEFIELNRLAFTDRLPRNSESRALGVAMRLLRKHAPHVKWVVSFADATRCGDGTIYRASGFVLTSIRINKQLYQLPFAEELNGAKLRRDGWSPSEIDWTRLWLSEITPKNGQLVGDHKLTVEDRPPAVAHKVSLEGHPHCHKMSIEGGHRPTRALSQVKKIMRRLTNGGTSATVFFRAIGGTIAQGYQLRYIYFVDKSYRDRLTVPEIPYEKIDEMGVGMYRGVKREVINV